MRSFNYCKCLLQSSLNFSAQFSLVNVPSNFAIFVCFLSAIVAYALFYSVENIVFCDPIIQTCLHYNKNLCALVMILDLKKALVKKLVSDEVEANAFSRCLERRIAVDDILCNKCRLSIYRNNSNKDSDCETGTDLSPSDASSDDPTFEVMVKSKEAVSETEYFEILIQRIVATHKYCCIGFSMKNLTVIPEEARIRSYIKKKIFIPPENRCCTTHILRNRTYEKDIGHLKVYFNIASLSASQLSKIMETLSIKCDLTLLDKIDEFSKQINFFTGLSWENLLEIK